MINTLLGKIAGFFEKDFLFASFLPALLFNAALFVTMAAIVGVSSTAAVYESWTGWQHASVAAGVAVMIVVAAYILSALRPAIAHFWSGTATFPLYLPWGYIQVRKLYQRHCFLRLQDLARPKTEWLTMFAEFEATIRSRWSTAGRRNPTPIAIGRLLESARIPVDAASLNDVRRRLQVISDAYGKYNGEDLVPVYQTLKASISAYREGTLVPEQTAQAELDRRFGTLDTIRATRLGNVIEAYNQYPHKRYKIEAEIFWPRLRQVIPAEYWAVVQEPRILLDFALAMSTGSAVYAAFAALVGPWLWFEWRLWLPLVLIAIGSTLFFYRLAIGAADQLGDLVRSSFDLFRLNLLKSLGLPQPDTLYAEQEIWEDFSRLAVYGTSRDFKLHPPS